MYSVNYIFHPHYSHVRRPLPKSFAKEGFIEISADGRLLARQALQGLMRRIDIH